PNPRNIFASTTISVTTIFFFFTSTAPTNIYTLSLHDALPICNTLLARRFDGATTQQFTVSEAPHFVNGQFIQPALSPLDAFPSVDRKSTRLNSSHVAISYAVFCLKKKKYNRYIISKRKYNIAK